MYVNRMKMLFAVLLLVVAVSARDWKAGDNGLVKWDQDCFFHANSNEVIGSKPARAEQCGGVCIAHPSCNHFSFNGDHGICYMISSGARTASDFSGGVCGFVPSRAWSK
jgi:hypothetical protein